MTPHTLNVLISVFLLPAIVFADDFKTVNGKEYKNAKVSRVEPDGIVLITKSGISKVYFTELPKEVQERFHYDAEKAASYTAEQNEKVATLERQRLTESQKRAEEREKYWSEHATPSPSQNGSSPNGSSGGRSTKLARNPTPPQGPRNCYMEVRDVLSGLEIQRN